MHKSYFSFLFLFLLVFSQAFPQNVNVSSPSLTYPDLNTAFTAINNGVHTGNISIEIVGNTTELVSAVLNASGTGAASYTSISIQPSGGALRTITGAISGHLIDLNGADNITINGLNAGGNSLIISNTSTGASSAIRFISDASNDLITNCNIQGSASSSDNGVVFFSTGAISGNDGNTISNCNITGTGGNLPINAIFSLGTSSAIANSGNTITANNLPDFFNPSLATSGINLSTGNSSWTISNNKLFQTANRIYTVANTHTAINISSGDNHTISGNIIGFANAGGTGTTNMIGMTSGSLGGTFPSSYTTGGTANEIRYIGINCAFSAGGIVSSIQNNTIAGFAFYTASTMTTTNGNFCAIAVTSGNADIGTIAGNTIGATSGNGSIYTSATTTGGVIVGIFATTANTITIKNNTIGALDAMGINSSFIGGITGINSAGTGSFFITNNIIGNTTNPNLRTGNLTEAGNLSNVGTTFSTANNLGSIKGILNNSSGNIVIGTIGEPNIIRNSNNNSSSASASYRGIETTAGITSITGNYITNMTSVTTNTLEIASQLGGLGILLTSTASGSEINNNVINNLSINNTGTASTNIAGIGASGAANLTISRNIIYNLSNLSTAISAVNPATVSGIFLRSGTTANTIVNNMITLGNGQATNTTFIGIWNNNGMTPNPAYNIYYNSIYITGTVSSGAQPSFGYVRGDLTATARTVTVNLRNNIFYNDRTGGTGKHYAISNNYGATVSAVGWSAAASDYNILNSANPNTIGYWTTDQNLTGWKTASAGDTASKSKNVFFVDIAAGNLRITGSSNGDLDLTGTPIAGITTDIDGNIRNASFPYIGANEGSIPLPVELTAFTSMTVRNEVILDWATSSEINNASFEIERSQVSSSITNFHKVGSIQGNGTTNEIKKYQFKDLNVQSGKYKYRLKQLDFNGNFQYYTLSNEVFVGVPDKYSLSQNYPNPFNPATKINYDLPKDGKVNLRIYDITGKEIAALINNEVQPAGYYTITFNASNLSSGVYFYKMMAGDFISTKKLVLLK